MVVDLLILLFTTNLYYPLKVLYKRVICDKILSSLPHRHIASRKKTKEYVKT